MNTLLTKANNNLTLLCNLSEKECLLSSPSRDLSIQKDYIQVENVIELENSIYFTFHQIMSSMDSFNIYQKNLFIRRLDSSINNIFENESLNKLLEDNSVLFQIVDDIDDKLSLIKDNVCYDSPFYNVYYIINAMKYTIRNMYYNPEWIKPFNICGSYVDGEDYGWDDQGEDDQGEDDQGEDDQGEDDQGEDNEEETSKDKHE